MGKRRDVLVAAVIKGGILDQQLIRDAEEECFREHLPRVNLIHFDDPREQTLCDRWFVSGQTFNQIEQKDAVGMLFLTRILRVSETTARKFCKHDRAAMHTVGMRQAGAHQYEPDFQNFWREIAELFPGEYTKDEIQWLSAESSVGTIFFFIGQLDQRGMGGSSVLRLIHINAHAYK